MFNEKSLKCIESKRHGCYQVQRRRFFCVLQCYFRIQESFNPVNREISILFTGHTDRRPTTDDRRQTDGQNRLLNPASRMRAQGNNAHHALGCHVITNSTQE